MLPILLLLLFLLNSQTAVTNKFPRLQDIKGFLILILILILNKQEAQTQRRRTSTAYIKYFCVLFENMLNNI